MENKKSYRIAFNRELFLINAEFVFFKEKQNRMEFFNKNNSGSENILVASFPLKKSAIVQISDSK